MRQALNLWNVNVYSYAYNETLFIIAAGFVTKLLTLPWRSKRQFKSSSIYLLLVLIVCLMAIFLSDVIALSGPRYINSYTTLAALSLSIYFIFVWSIISIIAFLASLTKNRIFSTGPILILFCFLALMFAQHTVLTRFSIPNWLSTNLVEDTVRDVVGKGKKINKIIVYQAERPLNILYPDAETFEAVEFNWLNLGDSFYVYWYLKNIFDRIKGVEMPGVVFIDRGKAEKKMDNPLGPNVGEIITFDFRKEALIKVSLGREGAEIVK